MEAEREQGQPAGWYRRRYGGRKTARDYARRIGSNQIWAAVLLGSSFLIRQFDTDSWGLPSARHLLISAPFMALGIALLLWNRALARKEKRELERFRGREAIGLAAEAGVFTGVHHVADPVPDDTRPARKGEPRGLKQWYQEEYAPKNVWDYMYRKGADEAAAIALLGSSFFLRYWELGRWAWPTLNDFLWSLPLMLLGAVILLRKASPDYKRKEARRWGLHDYESTPLETESGLRYRSACRCGWKGRLWDIESNAYWEQSHHESVEMAKRKGR